MNIWCRRCHEPFYKPPGACGCPCHLVVVGPPNPCTSGGDAVTDLPPYEQLTQQQRDEWCNGCGPKGWIRAPDLGFGEPCNVHDYLYYVGGGEPERLAADRRFLRDMLTVARGRSWWRRPWAVARAWLYYGLVRRFGGAHFTYRRLP